MSYFCLVKLVPISRGYYCKNLPTSKQSNHTIAAVPVKTPWTTAIKDHVDSLRNHKRLGRRKSQQGCVHIYEIHVKQPFIPKIPMSNILNPHNFCKNISAALLVLKVPLLINWRNRYWSNRCLIMQNRNIRDIKQQYDAPFHYCDAIMGTIVSEITSLTIVYKTVYSDADQSKHQSSASLAFVWGIHRDRWIPRTKGQLRGKCFHLMTSSCQTA